MWAYDFVFDTCANRQTLKCLTIVDEWTRECLAIDVAGGIRSRRVIEVLAQLVSVHGAPRHLRSDNEPEFVATAILRWLGDAGIDTALTLGFVIRWGMLRRDLRGSGAAIIALLGESCHEALIGAQSHGWAGWIEHRSETVYFKVGADDCLLCKRDLERLHALGYVYQECSAPGFLDRPSP